ncbi:MAG: hypothetical protein LBK70_01550 [Clostridiales bacterium]|jgi:triacylglycerol lipase|nr:hypothetical protein [Clostridiales bacterium]
MSNDLICATKYPILLVHGVGQRDQWGFKKWANVPSRLRQNGALVYHGMQDGWGTYDSNALQLKLRIQQILDQCNIDKVNIIAHSKGGCDARRLISITNGVNVASLTTLNTPHRGLHYVSRLRSIYPRWTISIVGFFHNIWYRILGDRHPQFGRVIAQFEPDYMLGFNEDNPDITGIYYASYSSVLHKGSWIARMVQRYDGDNDGIVSVDSAKWGNYIGHIDNRHPKGMKHDVIIGRKRLKGFDPSVFVVDIVKSLKDRGL